MKNTLLWLDIHCKFSSLPRKFSKEFMAWFGNSKVVDDKGQPLIVYKGMHPYTHSGEKKLVKRPGQFGLYEEWSENKIIDKIKRPEPFPAFNGQEPGIEIAGFFGTSDVASHFAEIMKGSVYPVYLSLQNPIIIDAKGTKAGFIQFGPTGKEFRDALRSGKYDGAIIKNTSDEGTIYVAKFPEQIRSSIMKKEPDQETIKDEQPGLEKPMPAQTSDKADKIKSNWINTNCKFSQMSTKGLENIKFKTSFSAQTKGIYIDQKWVIWDIDLTGAPSHGSVESKFFNKRLPALQAEISSSGYTGFLRVREEMDYKEAALIFVKASTFPVSDFDLMIELPSGRSSAGTLEGWLY